MDDLVVGIVEFLENEIMIKATTIYGDLECKTNYAEAFRLTDVESLNTIGQIGLYASWHNTFVFILKLWNENIFKGDCCFNVKIDNEFGSKFTPHFKLHYQTKEKEYIININEDGYPFCFNENKGMYEEKIVYNLLNDWGTCSYFSHSITDKYINGIEMHDYYANAFIVSDSNKTLNRAVVLKKFDGKWIMNKRLEFGRKSSDDEAEEEVIHKANFMSFIDPSMISRIHKLISEFSVDDESFLERIILYGFTNYSKEEVQALFGLDKENVDLEKMYFGSEDIKSLEKKLFS